MNILFVTSEAVPFAKTGGLADVAGVLPKEIKKQGHDIRLVMPRYYAISPEKYKLKRLKLALGVPMGIMGEAWCGVYEGRLPNSSVRVYFLEHEEYFGRDAIYNDANGEGFADNDKRFVFLSKASLQLAKALNFQADVVHANDWQSAAICVMLNTVYKNDVFFKHTASVLTIHNLQYQGVFFKGLIDVMGVGWQSFNVKELEFYDQVNLLKGGISHATVLTTVSPNYAKEIQTKPYGYLLDDLLRYRSEFLTGIINGVDYSDWGAAKDKQIIKNFTFKTIKDKAQNKAKVQEIFGLKKSAKTPLFAMITRLADQKGIDILMACFHRLMTQDIQFVLLGSGNAFYENFFRQMSNLYPNKFNAHIGYSEKLSHQIEAGADFFLMPSAFEPCGLNQIYSLAYATLPIVHAVGGLEDTVINLDESTKKGTGFKFYDYTPNALYDTICWAIYTYYNKKDTILAMQKQALGEKFLWKDSATQYITQYKRAMYLKSL